MMFALCYGVRGRISSEERNSSGVHSVATAQRRLPVHLIAAISKTKMVSREKTRWQIESLR